MRLPVLLHLWKNKKKNMPPTVVFLKSCLRNYCSHAFKITSPGPVTGFIKCLPLLVAHSSFWFLTVKLGVDKWALIVALLVWEGTVGEVATHLISRLYPGGRKCLFSAWKDRDTDLVIRPDSRSCLVFGSPCSNRETLKIARSGSYYIFQNGIPKMMDYFALSKYLCI